jgi:hypothetical protein
MRLIPHITVALFVVVCQGCSASSGQTAAQCPAGQHPLSVGCAWDPVEVAIGPGHDASGCPQFSPNPASAYENQLVQWTNKTSATLNVYQSEGTNNGIPPKLLATIDAGQTSAGDFWRSAESVDVYSDGCGSSSGGIITISGGASGSATGGTSGSGCQSGSYCYEWNCNGDSECLAANPNGTATGANDEGNDPSCSGLLMFGQQFWNIPPATQSCALTP